MKQARSQHGGIVHEIDLFCLLADAEREAYRPLDCNECSGDATYVRESVNGRGAHFRASHLPDCGAASLQGPSETEGRVSWREGDRPATLDTQAPAVLWAGTTADNPSQRPPPSNTRRASRPSRSGEPRPPQRPSLATLLKYAQMGGRKVYPNLKVCLTEDDELDVALALCSFHELAKRSIGERVVAFGRINRADPGSLNLALYWEWEQSTALEIPLGLLPASLAAGWERVRVEQYRPWFISLSTLRRGTRSGRPYLRAEDGLFLLDLRPMEPVAGLVLRPSVHP